MNGKAVVLVMLGLITLSACAMGPTASDRDRDARTRRPP